MRRRIQMSQRLFLFGLLVMLLAGIGSTVVWPDAAHVARILIVGGGAIAVAARLWQRRLHRLARQLDPLADLAGYPLTMLRDPSFTGWQRSAA